jgi:hypothetical protein
MNIVQLTPEDLLAGAENTFEIAIPPELLHPDRVPATARAQTSQTQANQTMVVQLRPLTIGTFQLVMKAAKQDAGFIPLLMIKESLVQPTLTLEQIKQLPLGLVNFLIDHIRQISGLTGKKSPLVT